MKFRCCFAIFFLCFLLSETQAQQALNLTASPQWVNLGDLDVSGNKITVECLFYRSPGSGPDLISKHSGPANVNYLLRPSTFEINVGNSYYNVANPYTIQDNTWYHIAGTYDGSFLRYYLNGCLIAQVAATGNLAQQNLNAAIGNISSSPNGEQFLGMIDEVRIWNVARTQAQIAANMTNLPNPTTQTGLMAYYQFEGNLINAQGTASRNGTAVGTISYAADNVTIQQFAITGATVCAPASAVGTVTISSNDLNATYSSDGTNFQASNTFTGISSGSHTFYARSMTGCTLDTILIIPVQQTTQNITLCPGESFTRPNGTVENTSGSWIDTLSNSLGCDSIITTNLSVISNTLAVSNDTAVCSGHSASLNATGAFAYTWTPATGLSNANIANPVAAPTATTPYVVRALLTGNNLIANGDFEAGNTGFSTTYTYSANNTTQAQYAIGTNPHNWNSNHTSCGDHTTGSGNMMFVDGAPTPNVSIWCETVNVTPNTDYAFSSWISSNYPTNPAILQFSINSSLLAAPFSASGTTCNWQQFYATWNSGINTTANICIVNQNTITAGNDFSLDDISFSAFCVVYDTVIVTVKNPSYYTQNPVICANETFTRPNGISVNTTGIYKDTLAAANGCDSIITTNLTVNPVQQTTQTITLCPGEVFTRANGSIASVNGTYIDTVPNSLGCDSIITTNLTIAVKTLAANNDTVICQGHSVQMNATGALNYTWTPTAGLSNANIANPVAAPSTTTQYIVHSQQTTMNLIVNGNFSLGNVNFSSSYTYQTNLQPEGTYYIGTNPNTYHSGFSACPDHTTGTGNMMIVNGAGTANVSVLCQSVPVKPNTDYAFGCWVTSVSTGSPAILQFKINGSLLSTPFTAPSTTCTWQQFYTIWNSGSNTSANICIVNQNTATGGNDFALDDISFSPICNVSDTVNIVVKMPAQTVQNDTICQGETFTRPNGTVVNTGGTYSDTLHTVANCDSIITTNLMVYPTYNVSQNPVICANQTFTRPNGTVVNTGGTYIDTLQTVNGCDSIITTNLTVNPLYNISQNDTICAYQTFTRPAGSVVNTSGTYIDTVPTAAGCDSVITTFLTVIDLSLSHSSSNPLCFGGSNGTINVTRTGGLPSVQYTWSNPSFSGTAISNVSANNYRVTATDAFGCTASDAIVISQPPQLTVAPTYTEPLCYGEANGTISAPAQGGTPPYHYQLNGVNSAVDSFENLRAGAYLLTVTDSNNCSVQANVTVTEPDSVYINYSPSVLQVLLSGIPFNLTTNYGNNAVFSWSPADGLSCADCPNPIINPDSATRYMLTVTVAPHDKNCVYQFPLLVGVNRGHNYYVPNAFSPNGNTVNDYFQIFTEGEILKQLHIQIFNRWGEKVFESYDEDFKWDGTFKGNVVSPGIYVYYLELVFMDNTVQNLDGSITVIR